MRTHHEGCVEVEDVGVLQALVHAQFPHQVDPVPEAEVRHVVHLEAHLALGAQALGLQAGRQAGSRWEEIRAG